MPSVFIPVVHYHYDCTEPIGGSGTDDEPVPAFATREEAEASPFEGGALVSRDIWEIELPQGFAQVRVAEGDVL